MKIYPLCTVVGLCLLVFEDSLGKLLGFLIFVLGVIGTISSRFWLIDGKFVPLKRWEKAKGNVSFIFVEHIRHDHRKIVIARMKVGDDVGKLCVLEDIPENIIKDFNLKPGDTF